MAGVMIGVLSLQGDFAAHARAVREAGGEALEIRRIDQLDALRGLIIPGGESTTLLTLLGDSAFGEALRDFHARGGALLGTCAGLILLAREVLDPPQPSLGLLDVAVRRNAYGRQVESFIAHGSLRWNGNPPENAEMVFIRAPRILRVGPGVEILGELDGEATFVRQGRIWGATFHPELSSSREIHERFLALAGEG